MMALYSRLRRTVALVVCPELRAADADRVASNPELAEVPAYAQIIDGRLHWVPERPSIEVVERLQEAHDAYVRANQRVPAAISAALASAFQQSPYRESLPAFRVHRDGDQSGAEAMRCCPFLSSAPRGARR